MVGINPEVVFREADIWVIPTKSCACVHVCAHTSSSELKLFSEKQKKNFFSLQDPKIYLIKKIHLGFCGFLKFFSAFAQDIKV